MIMRSEGPDELSENDELKRDELSGSDCTSEKTIKMAAKWVDCFYPLSLHGNLSHTW